MNKIATATYLKDYKISNFFIKTVHLTFKLDPKNTKVIAKILFLPQSDSADLKLDGVNLKLEKASINNKSIDLRSLILSEEGLTVPKKLVPKTNFLWEAETTISPETNTALEGLYLSAGTYCTQCEAEGFRKITFFLDRPDIMAIYTVRVEGNEPALLSNGNPIRTGENFVEWFDPWPKPSYLFALVAGDLVSFNDTFKTTSGRSIDLKIFVKPKDIDKCSYAMEALKKAMKWDEQEYEREYDLNLFMIVAIDDFNMGAMENKGLNIFNSRYVLADEKTATDSDFENIERIIAHEYFHNWTGNRITCRDWFQLCLKEGLTVFRDQQFAASMRGFSLKRIEDVLMLQAKQFREDDGPLAHPVRPSKYIEINNFYTATVYEKGAELVRMLRLIVGSKNYNDSMKNYFATFDGQACTIEDWLEVFEKITKISLKHFAYWYSQAGRPIVKVTNSYDKGTFKMNFCQELEKNRQKNMLPMLIPISVGLLDRNGNEMRKTKTFLISKKKQTITFNNLPSRPVPSTLRDFSAPITLAQKITDNELFIFGEHDTNLFNRWNAIRLLSLKAIEGLIYDGLTISDRLLSALKIALSSNELTHGYKAMIATAPTESDVLTYLSKRYKDIDPQKIYKSVRFFNESLSRKCSGSILELLNDIKIDSNYKPTAEQSGTRAFKLRLLDLLNHQHKGIHKTKYLFMEATNMTEEIGALTLLIKHNSVTTEKDQFYNKWQSNKNVIDKWFAVQAAYTCPEKIISVLSRLTKQADFNIENPNRFRSVIEAFGVKNLAGFHQKDGNGYKLVTNWLCKLDRINPQTTARICTVFDNWKIFDKNRQKKIEENLLRLANMSNISKNTYEIVNSILYKNS